MINVILHQLQVEEPK